MKKRKFGNTNLLVSEIGLGCWQLGGLKTINGIATTYGDVDEKTAGSIVKKAIDLGINTFDTADSYSLGNSEKRLGKFLEDYRKDIHIFTKAGNVLSNSSNKIFDIDLSYNHLTLALDRSLNRLRTNYVDLFLAHKAPQNEEEFAGIEKAFNEIKSEGKALYCGVSVGREYEKAIKLIELGIVDSIQIYFSLIDYSPITNLLSLASKKGIGIIAAEPLHQGFLTGKYKKDHIFPKSDVRSGYEREQLNKLLEKANQFSFLENELRTLAQASIAYVFNQQEISTCIPGAKSVMQLESNVHSTEINLTKDELEKISKIQQNW